MEADRRSGRGARGARLFLVALAGLTGLTMAWAIQIPTTLADFHLPGTQIGDVQPGAYQISSDCRTCHGDYEPASDPWSTWSGSLMAQAGRDPLFLAQMTNANQDVADVGYFCLRCHVPMSFATGHAYQSDGSTLDAQDKDGVGCHFCHSVVDPVYAPGVSPPEDADILRSLVDVPRQYGNAMFVLDPSGSRRGPRADAAPLHELIQSPFHRRSEMCGTCHDVGNVATNRQPDGTYRYNTLGQAPRSADPHAQFPLERTYTEWKLSAFASGGVDMGGRFGGDGAAGVSSCQDCHMPLATGRAASMGPERTDLRKHDFAGATAPVLRLIAEAERGNPEVDQAALRRGIAKATSMLERAATLQLSQTHGNLLVRVVNESGHKLPTGHIEGRRVFLTVRFLDAQGQLLREYGHYDATHADLDASTTRVYEMTVGLSESAASVTGLPPGPTGHMSLADTVVKDTRIPPRGYDVAAFADGGAPIVGAPYLDGQHWDNAWFAVPLGAARVEVELSYQCLPREYIEHLRDGNVTDDRGRRLFDLWERTGKGAPIVMARATEAVHRFLFGDVDGDCVVGRSDGWVLIAALGTDWSQPAFVPAADLDGDHRVGTEDWAIYLQRYGSHCP